MKFQMMCATSLFSIRYFILGVMVTAAGCTKDTDEDFPAPSVVVPAAPAATAVPNTFQVGDVLELFVKEDATLNGSYAVREGGYIVIPRAGRLSVAGLTREQAEPKVKEFLEKSQLTQANVIVERMPTKAPATGMLSQAGQSIPRVLVYITGSVPRSGGHAIPVPAGKSVGVYEALLISGGVNKFASLDKVEIFRFDPQGKRKKATLDLRPIMEGAADDPPISEGDIINVPEKVFGF